MKIEFHLCWKWERSPPRPYRHLKFTSFHGLLATHGRAHLPFIIRPIHHLSYLINKLQFLNIYSVLLVKELNNVYNQPTNIWTLTLLKDVSGAGCYCFQVFINTAVCSLSVDVQLCFVIEDNILVAPVFV